MAIQFTCDLCGGKLVMKGAGKAICEDCGMEYDSLFEESPEERDTLMAEWKELSAKLDAEYKELHKIPIVSSYIKLTNDQKNLEASLNSLGVFDFSKKKKLHAELEDIRLELHLIEPEYERISEEFDKSQQKLWDKIYELEEKLGMNN